MSLRLIDFLPLIMAVTVSAIGLAFVKLLVYLHRRQMAHPDVMRADMKRPATRRQGVRKAR